MTHPNADTYGWDAAFAISYTHANAAITTSWPTVNPGAKHLAQAASDDPSFAIDATLGPWQLTVDGDGRNVRFACPITAGSYTAGARKFDFAGTGCEVIIEVGMEWVPNPGQFAFVLSGNQQVGAITGGLDKDVIDAGLRTAFAQHGRPLTASAKVAKRTDGVEWLIEDGTANYYLFHTTDKFNDQFLNIYQFEQDWASNLKVLAQSAGAGEPAVTVISIVKNPSDGIAADVLPELLTTWFNTNIGEFNHVFAALDLSPVVAGNDRFAWLKPTATSYAVTDKGSMDTSVFGVLTMALGNQPPASHQVSPNAIPAGAEAGFLISGPMFAQQMLLTGARTIFGNAPVGHFRPSNDGRSVTNTEELVWGKFMLDNKQLATLPVGADWVTELDQRQVPAYLNYELSQLGIILIGYTVTVQSAGSQWLLTGSSDEREYILDLNGTNIEVYEATTVTIAKEQFAMTVADDHVEIQFIDLLYNYSSDFDVHVNYTEKVGLGLQDAGNGNQALWFTRSAKNLVVSVTKTRYAITRDIVLGAVFGALALVAVAGPIVEGLTAGTEIGEVGEDGGEAVVDAEAFENAENANPGAAADDAADAAGKAAARVGSRLTNIKNAFATTKWMAFGALVAAAGAATGFFQLASTIIENAERQEWKSLPAFDDFAGAVIAPYSWPHVAGFPLRSAGLANSLQIGLGVSPS